jgi:hypothetical protein
MVDVYVYTRECWVLFPGMGWGKYPLGNTTLEIREKYGMKLAGVILLLQFNNQTNYHL